MSVGYKAVLWNRQKRIYDGVMLAAVGLYLALFVGIGALVLGFANKLLKSPLRTDSGIDQHRWQTSGFRKVGRPKATEGAAEQKYLALGQAVQ